MSIVYVTNDEEGRWTALNEVPITRVPITDDYDPSSGVPPSSWTNRDSSKPTLWQTLYKILKFVGDLFDFPIDDLINILQVIGIGFLILIVAPIIFSVAGTLSKLV